ncbi:MAG: excinuclease ABC subunit UvrA, partial [Verrucomicrobiales bacterium]
MSSDVIKISGARQHNLQNISLEIPRNQFVVITGVSGSGKSSLAFHTLYAEGQRRYVESLSAYARQFLEKLEKPDVDFIEGLSPAIAIEQRTASSTPRSTIATVTEIYDYLRILYSALGQPHDPKTGQRIQRKSVQELVEELMKLAEGTRVLVLAPMVLDEYTKLSEVTNRLRREGFVRVRIDGEIHDLEGEFTKREFPHPPETVEAVVDRLVIRPDSPSRLTDSIETALKWSRPRVAFLTSEGDDQWELREETTAFANPETGFTLETLTPRHFSFNSHLGACETCQGLGALSVVDPDLIITKPDKALLDGAYKNWWSGQKALRLLHEERIQKLAATMKIDLSAPFEKLPESFQEAALFGTDDFEGLGAEAARLLEETESQRLRQSLQAFTSDQTCPGCQGQRLRPEILGVTLRDLTGNEFNIAAFTKLPIAEALEWMHQLDITEKQARFIGEVRAEVTKRLHFLDQVGL